MTPIEKLVLETLQDCPLDGNELYLRIADKVDNMSYADVVTDILAVMAEKGMVILDRQAWEWTALMEPPLSLVKAMPSPERVVGKRDYDGAELKATCLRPGAYDFLRCPSRMGDKLLEHRLHHLAGAIS